MRRKVNASNTSCLRDYEKWGLLLSRQIGWFNLVQQICTCMVSYECDKIIWPKASVEISNQQMIHTPEWAHVIIFYLSTAGVMLDGDMQTKITIFMVQWFQFRNMNQTTSAKAKAQRGWNS